VVSTAQGLGLRCALAPCVGSDSGDRYRPNTP